LKKIVYFSNTCFDERNGQGGGGVGKENIIEILKLLTKFCEYLL